MRKSLLTKIGEDKEMREIDGSYLEGGGAIVRIASALSAITGTAIRIGNIRAGRKKPGLMTQHLESLKAVASLCSGRLSGGFLGSTEIELHPGKLGAGTFSIEIGTAGAIGLLFQAMCAPMCMAEGDVTLSIRGGATFAKWAPPLPAISHVLLPALSRMGFRVEIEVLRHGFYPKGGARVHIIGHPCKRLQPLQPAEPGETRLVQGVSVASDHLRNARVADRQALAAQQALARSGLAAAIECEYVDAANPGSGIALWTETATGAFIGGDSTGERGKPSERVGEEAAGQILRTLGAGAAVDEHLSDQLLIFMALAEGRSVITTPRLTDHAKTNIYVIQQFLPAEFQLHENGAVMIECSGRSASA
jgi:RNA 3'-phosphate cyclase